MTINKNILIIADRKQSYIDSLQQELEEHKFKVSIAYDGMSGINMARTLKPDLILIEAMLSGFTGYQICSLLKLDVKYEDRPIIIITDKNDEKSKIIVKDSKADGFLEKPIDLEILLNKLKQ